MLKMKVSASFMACAQLRTWPMRDAIALQGTFSPHPILLLPITSPISMSLSESESALTMFSLFIAEPEIAKFSSSIYLMQNTRKFE